jgi:hypothetical protein
VSAEIRSGETAATSMVASVHFVSRSAEDEADTMHTPAVLRTALVLGFLDSE